MIDVAPGLTASGLPTSRREVAGLCRAILEALDLDGRDFDLRLVGDGEIATLNEAFLGCPGPTNVLSCPAEDPQRPDYLGNLALSLDTATREAFLYGQDPLRHMTRLLAHGFLHLAGLDHGPVMDALTDTAVEAVCPDADLEADAPDQPEAAL